MPRPAAMKSSKLRSGERRHGAPSSFQSLKKDKENAERRGKREKKKREELEKEIKKVKEEKEELRKEKEKLEGELWVERERRQDLVNAAVRARPAAMGMASPF